MRAAAAVVLALAFAAAGCGADRRPASARERGRVVAAVHELQRAAERGDAGAICRRILARGVAEQFAAAGVDCAVEVRRALRRVARFGLTVERVRITGETATALVRSPSGRRRTRHTVALVKQSGDWRIASVGLRGR